MVSFLGFVWFFFCHVMVLCVNHQKRPVRQLTSKTNTNPKPYLFAVSLSLCTQKCLQSFTNSYLRARAKIASYDNVRNNPWGYVVILNNKCLANRESVLLDLSVNQAVNTMLDSIIKRMTHVVIKVTRFMLQCLGF